MAKPLIFISHSAKEPEADQLLTALVACLQNDFDVLLDRTRLQEGTNWRKELHVWLGVCDAAIILFSEHALDSPWVLKEATILTWRRALDPSFVVLPVLLPPVDRSKLEASQFAPLAVNEIQRVRGETQEAIVERVHARLHDVAVHDESPLQKLETMMVSALRNISQQAYQEVVEQLRGIPEPWSSSADYSVLLSRRLLQADLQTLVNVMPVLAPNLSGPDAALRILEILAPFWVNPFAVTRIPIVAKQQSGTRIIGVNTQLPFTGEMYVRRACCLFPTWWPTAKVTNVHGGDQFGALVFEIRQALRQELGLLEDDPDEEIDQALVYHEQDKQEPVCILLPGPIDNDILQRLRHAFPSCTFILLLGDTHSNTLGGQIEILDPPLDSQQERRAYNLYRDARRIVKKSYPTL